MSAQKLRPRRNIISGDVINEADTPQQLGKRTSESQDVTSRKKKKRTPQTNIKSPIKGKSIKRKKKTILPGKKKTQELPEEDRSNIEENNSLLDEKEKTFEGGDCLSVKSIENDFPPNDDHRESVSDNRLEEKQTNPSPNENEMRVTQSDISFEMVSNSFIRGEKYAQSQVKNVLSKNDSKEDISLYHEDETLGNINYSNKQENSSRTTKETESESSSDHQINSFSKDLIDESNKVSTDAKPQEKSNPIENIFENIIETGNINDCLEFTNKIKELALDEAQTQSGTSSEQIISNKDKTDFRDTVCGNPIEIGNINELIEEREVVTNETEEFKTSDEVQTQSGMNSERIHPDIEKTKPRETVCEDTIKTNSINDCQEERELDTNQTEESGNSNETQSQAGMSSEQTLSYKDKLEFKETMSNITFETENINDLVEEIEMVIKGSEELNISDDAQTQTGKSSEQSLSIKDKMEFKETVCDNTNESGNINELIEKREVVTNGAEDLIISGEAQIRAGMSSEQTLSNKDKMEFKETVCDNTNESENINELVEEREMVTNGAEDFNISDEAQTQAGMSSEQTLSNKDKMEFTETVCGNTIDSGNIDNFVEKRELVTNGTENLKISGEAITEAGMFSEQTLSYKEKLEFKEAICDNTIETGNINELIEKREMATKGSEELNVSDEAQTKTGKSLEQTLSYEDKLEFKETITNITFETGNTNDLLEEREMVIKGSEELNISDDAQTQTGKSSEQSLSIKDKMEFKETVCDNTNESGNINELVEEREMVTNGAEDLNISDEAQIQAGMSSEQTLSNKDEMEFKEAVCDNTNESGNINELVEEREMVTNGAEDLNISDEAQTQAGMSSEQTLSKDKMEFTETVCGNTIDSGNIDNLVEKRELVTNETEKLKISGEAQTEAGMFSEQKLSYKEKLEFKEAISDNTIETGNINELIEEREMDTKGSEELNVSDEAQTQTGKSLEQTLSYKDKLEFKETITNITFETGNTNDLLEEREMVIKGSEELNISDDAQTQTGKSSEQSLSIKDKMEFKETVRDNIESANIDEFVEERGMVINGTEGLNISYEAQTQAGMSSEQTFSNKDKMEFTETVCDNTIDSRNINELIEEREFVTSGTEGLKISDEFQNQAGMNSERIHPDIEKTEPKETVCEDTIESSNINDCQEERELVTNQTKEVGISNESQNQCGMSSEKDKSDKETMEDKDNFCEDSMKTRNNCQEEKELVKNQTEEAVLNGRHIQAGITSEQNLLDKENIKHKETVCEITIETGKNNICLEERELIRNKPEELEISDEAQNLARITSEKVLSDKKKTKQKTKLKKKKNKILSEKETVFENAIRTLDDLCQKKMELVTNQPEQMEISDEEDNIKQFIDENVIRSSQLPERENYQERSYRLPAMDDPVWRNRLPPPPGCEESPPPSPPPPPPPKPTPPLYMNSFLDTEKILKSAKTTTSGQIEIEFEINHLPKFTVDYLVKKCVRENQIKTVSGAMVCTRGQYIAPFSIVPVNHASWRKPLHLFIMAPSRQSLETALGCVKKLIAEGEETEDIKGVKVFFERLLHAPSDFKLNDRILGKDGANLKYITEQIGVELTLRGRSSGYLEASGLEAPCPLHLLIRHNTPEGLIRAKEIAVNLVQTLSEELREFCGLGQQTSVAHSVPSGGQSTELLQPAMMPTMVPAPVVPSSHNLPAPVTPPSQTSSWLPEPSTSTIPPLMGPLLFTSSLTSQKSLNSRSFASGSRPLAFAGSNSVPFAPAVATPFTVNPINPLAFFETVGQHANRAGNSSSLPETKVVYEAAPQLKSQTTKSILKTSLPSPPPFQFLRPPPPMPRPHPRPSLAVSSSNVTVPPPLRNPPSAAPLHLRPPSLPVSSEIRKDLMLRLKNKKEDVERKTKDKKSPSQTSKKADNKPKKIKFSIITATKATKVVPSNPLVQKKTSSSEDQGQTEAEKVNSPNEASKAETEISSSLEKKNKNTSRWGQKPQEPNKAKQLLKRLDEQINNMPCGGDKFRLMKILKLLQCAVPQTHDINDKERSQSKVIMELLQKTVKYLPSNQLSKTLWEILTTLKTEISIVTDERSSEPQNVFSASNNNTEALMNEIRAQNEADERETSRRRERESKKSSSEADERETSRRRERESKKSSSEADERETSRRRERESKKSSSEADERETSRRRERESQKSSSEADERETSRRRERESQKSSSTKHAHTSKSHSQESRSRRESHRTSSNKANDQRMSRASTPEQKRGESLKTSSDRQSKKMKETTQSVSSKRKSSSETNGDIKEPKRMKSEDLSPTSSNKGSDLRISGASTKEQKLGDSLKTLSDKQSRKMIESIQNVFSNRETSSEMYGEIQEPKTMKPEVLSPKPSKSPLSGELNQIVELLHSALKTAANSLQNSNAKLELSQIAQLLEHALSTGVEASDEQKSQFLIVLDVLEKVMQRNISALGQKSAHITSIISLLKNFLNSNLKLVNTCDKDNKETSFAPCSTMHLTHTSSETRQLPETKAKTESGNQQSDQLIVITRLLQKAIKNYADTMEQGVMKMQLTVISQSLEQAASKSGRTTEKEQSNLLTIIELLEQLLTNNQPSSSHQPKELLGIMQQLKRVLESKAFGSTSNIQQNISKPIDKMKTSLTNVQTLNTPTNQHQAQLLQIIHLLQKSLHSYCISMEQGYLKSQLTHFSQLLDRELQENFSTMSLEQLKIKMSPLVQMLQKLLQNQPTSNNESKQLVQILQLIEKNLNPPVTMSHINPQSSNLLGNLQQLQMLQTLQQQMQGGLQLGMGLPFQPMQMQAAPIANNLLQLQFMQLMQQMQAALGSQSRQPANPVSDQLNQLSQQLKTLQQQFTQVSQLNQQQPFQTTAVPQQQPLIQSLSAAGPQSFMQPTTMTQPQANISDLMLQLQQASQKFKGNE